MRGISRRRNWLMARPRKQPLAAAGTKPGGQARTVLRDAINEHLTPERAKQLIEDAFGAENVAAVECPECGNKFRAPVPDVKKTVDAITALVQEAEGRPEQRAPQETQITIERPPFR